MDIDNLVKQIKLNCDISDARFWGNYSICGLLMRLRELYLSEHSLNPWDTVSLDLMTQWVNKRENLWHEIEGLEYNPLLIEGKRYDPFDVNEINRILNPSGLVYGSGYGTMNKPSFFLAEIVTKSELLDYDVFSIDRELCRDLATFPAMLQGNCIYIRYEAIRNILWDKFQIMKGRRYGGVLEEMFSCFGIRKDESLSVELIEKLSDATHYISDMFIMHEIGEAFEDDSSDEWSQILQFGIPKKTELYIRAIKDIIADTSDKGTLKGIIKDKNMKLMFVYMAFLDAIRKEIFPEIRNAFQFFVENGNWDMLEDARVAGYKRATSMKNDVLKLSREADALVHLNKYLQEINTYR